MLTVNDLTATRQMLLQVVAGLIEYGKGGSGEVFDQFPMVMITD